MTLHPMYINRPIDVEYAVSKCCHGQPTPTAIIERQRPDFNQFINYRLSLLFTLSCESTVKSFNNSAIRDTPSFPIPSENIGNRQSS